MPATLMTEQAPKDMGIDVALKEYCGIESTAFALAVIRPDGQISTFLSDDMKTDPKCLFTPKFQDKLLMASGRQPLHQNMPKREFSAEGTELQTQTRNCRNCRNQFNMSYRKRTPPSAYDDGHSTDSSKSPGSRKRFRTTTIHSRDRAAPTLLTRTITIGDDEARDIFYRQCLTDIQQNGCKLIGKAWVKLLEPTKQSTYPYTKGAPKRPPWWPNNIRHKEPDHLHKRERIILLMHIFGLIVSQDPTGLSAKQREIDVAKLDEVSRKAMATWFENPKNAEKRGFLTQLFCVLYNEERYRRGELDGSTTVCVNDDSTTMCVNDGARPIDHDDADDEDGIHSSTKHNRSHHSSLPRHPRSPHWIHTEGPPQQTTTPLASPSPSPLPPTPLSETTTPTPFTLSSTTAP